MRSRRDPAVPSEYEELRRIAVRVAGQAAGLLRDYACIESFAESVRGETIRADLEAESFIVDLLRSEGVRYRIVSEEAGVLDGTSDIAVLVDPLDGSKNYSNCIPWSSVSIAFVEAVGGGRGVPVAGAVAPVFYGDVISFSYGGGCWLGGARIEPARPPSRFIYVYIEHPEAAERIARLVAALRGGFKIRSLGSAALEVAYTGLGRGYAFVDLRSKLRNIDLAAALGVASECGGAAAAGGARIESLSVERVEGLGSVVATSPGVDLEDVTRILWGRPAQ